MLAPTSSKTGLAFSGSRILRIVSCILVKFGSLSVNEIFAATSALPIVPPIVGSIRFIVVVVVVVVELVWVVLTIDVHATNARACCAWTTAPAVAEGIVVAVVLLSKLGSSTSIASASLSGVDLIHRTGMISDARLEKE